MITTKTIIIAEAGINHNGKVSIAKKLIDAASLINADFIKFQTYKTENISTDNIKKAEYQKKNDKNKNQFDMLKKYELTNENFIELYNYAIKKNIGFLSSPFDIQGINFLTSLGLKLLKIPSGEITNYPYLVHLAKKKKRIIISTGMSTINEIKKAIKILIQNGLVQKKITLLHCVSEYPTDPNKANLLSIKKLKEECNLTVGFSDHSLGIEVSKIAVAVGAQVIEKHITLNTKMIGPDHSSSLNIKEFKKMILEIRKIEKILGQNKKKPTKQELENSKLVRKKIVASNIIIKGDIFSSKNLTTKRSISGLSAIKWNSIIGKKAKKNYNINEGIKD